MRFGDVVRDLEAIHCRGSLRIGVIGPHRAGTTIAMRCIADSMRIVGFPEEELRDRDDCGPDDQVIAPAAFKVAGEPASWVVQCPGLTHVVDRIAMGWTSSLNAVVFMDRPEREVLDSLDRASKAFASLNDRQRAAMATREEFAPYCRPEWSEARMKTAVWYLYLKHVVYRPFALEYHSLKRSRLWVSERDRRRERWGGRQTALKEGRTGVIFPRGRCDECG